MGGSRNHKIELLEKTKIKRGSNPDKEFWKANLIVINEKGEELKRPVFLVKREVYDRRTDDPSARYVSIWTKMKEAGLPVLPTVAAISKTGILETDLTADGSKLYGKDTNTPEKNVSSPIDKIFADVNIDEIEKTSKEVAELAAKNQIGIFIDHGFDLLVKPDGMYKVMNRDFKKIKSENLISVEMFITHIKATKKFL